MRRGGEGGGKDGLAMISTPVLLPCADSPRRIDAGRGGEGGHDAWLLL